MPQFAAMAAIVKDASRSNTTSWTLVNGPRQATNDAGEQCAPSDAGRSSKLLSPPRVGPITRVLLNVSMNAFLGCRARGYLLRLVGVRLPEDGKVSRGTRLGGLNVSMGSGFGANEECWIDDHVTIGDRVRMGARVTIVTQSHPVGGQEQRRGSEDVTRPVRIGDGAWLHTGCMVMPGANIADGCIILAGAVVTKPTLPHGMYAGVPATRIRNLADG